MEFSGFIEYDSLFLFNLLSGFIISLPLWIWASIMTRSVLVKIVLMYGIAVYIFPFFIIKSWARYDISFDFLAIPYLFIFLYIASYSFLSKIGRKRRVCASVVNKYNFDVQYLRNIGFIILIFWIFYFIIFDKYSAFFLYIQDIYSDKSVRFVFYEAPPYIQLLYALTGRFIIPCFIMYQLSYGGNFGLLSTLVLSLFVLVQSGERQNLFILFATLIFSAFLIRNGRKRRILIFLMMFAMVIISMGIVFKMQGNVSHAAEVGLLVIIKILFQRVILDPYIMFGEVYNIFDGIYLLGGTNKIFSFLNTDKIGWTAIGVIADAWINFGIVGILLCPVMYSILLIYSVRMLHNIRHYKFMHSIVMLLYLISFISIYYSNLFSLVPIFVYLFVTMIVILIKWRFDNFSRSK